MTYPCPCCGYLVFAQPPGSSEICPICCWEDDVSQLRFPAAAGGANRPSLVAAQVNFAKIGASEAQFLDRVRKAQANDRRDADWRPINPAHDLACTPLGQALGYPTDRTQLYYWRAKS